MMSDSTATNQVRAVTPSPLLKQTLEQAEAPAVALAFAPDGARLAVGGHDGPTRDRWRG